MSVPYYPSIRGIAWYGRIPATDPVNVAVPGLQDPVNMAVSAPPQKSASKRVYAPELQLAAART